MHPRNTDHMAIVRAIDSTLRLLFFVFHAVAACVFLGISIDNNSNRCHVRHTYRQEFLSKVQADPYYSALNNMFRKPGDGNAMQMQSDVVLFPIVHKDESQHSVLQVQSSTSEPGIYVYNSTNKAFETPTQSQRGLAAQLMSMLLFAPKTGNVIGNFERCIMDADDKVSFFFFHCLFVASCLTFCGAEKGQKRDADHLLPGWHLSAHCPAGHGGHFQQLQDFSVHVFFSESAVPGSHGAVDQRLLQPFLIWTTHH